MTRNELITIAINAQVLANEDEIDSVLDVLEPVIRADEREKVNVSWKDDFDAEMDSLQGKVQAFYDDAKWAIEADAYHKVLVLLGKDE